MLNKFLSSLNLKGDNNNTNGATKRRYSRRGCDKCVSVIGDKTYPVENWSLGGLQIYGDSRPFGIENEIDVLMKFKLRDTIMEVPHRARVVRKTHEKVAFEFMPLSQTIRKNLQSVVDDHVANQFADSHMA